MNDWCRDIRAGADRAELHRAGVVSGRRGAVEWVLVDPERYPLIVWERRPGSRRTYARTARRLNAAAITNGPYMGRIGREAAAARMAAAVTVAALGGSAAPGRRTAGAALGGLAGLGVGWWLAFTGWIPCGVVRGESSRIDDRRDWHREGETHGWLGRSGEGFGSYAVGLGNPPDTMREAMGGLVPLIVDGRALGTDPAAPDFHADYARSRDKRPIVAWCLLPVPGLDGGGVLLVVASGRADAGFAPALLDLGVIGAVATDTSGCGMLGTGRRFLVGPPRLHRQSIQRYGLCCKAD